MVEEGPPDEGTSGIQGTLSKSLAQSHLDPAPQDCVQMASEDLEEWRLPNFPGQPVPMVSHP